MKELKMGDVIEVSDNGDFKFGLKKIFVKHGEFGVICVRDNDKDRFLEGRAFNTMHWSYWRPVGENKYRPFTFEDREWFRGKWIKEKNENELEYLIIAIFSTGIKAAMGNIIAYKSYDVLLADYEFTDGTPCGVKL